MQLFVQWNGEIDPPDCANGRSHLGLRIPPLGLFQCSFFKATYIWLSLYQDLCFT